ncbi:MAG TPA: monovalent cation/H(+) antiporter subunit G [Candidatus Methanofastidiosa archaeon]|nr:monovalent cation/H(+) antiporter subunit G [Candidatus Methanofastidiosa archaeon]HPR41538.1 monovalent cation/H(+) antiporter subunit G [Candidatus Methanofastidiosa archaeon]
MIIVQPIVFIISGLLILVASYGLLRFEKMPNILYARLHIMGVIDFACIISLVAIGHLNVALVAVLYFILTPVAVHSIAKSQYEGGAGDDY